MSSNEKCVVDLLTNLNWSTESAEITRTSLILEINSKLGDVWNLVDLMLDNNNGGIYNDILEEKHNILELLRGLREKLRQRSY